MKAHRYFWSSMIFVIAVGLFVYTVESGNYAFSIFGKTFNFPIAVWFVLPIGIFVLLSVFHITFHSFSFNRKLSNVEKDYESLGNFFKEAILQKENDVHFITKKDHDLIHIVEFISGKNPDLEDIKEEEIKELISMVIKLKSGEVQDLKKYKLDEKNALFIKNEENILAKDKNYAEVILKDSKNEALREQAYKSLVRNSPYEEIAKYDAIKTIKDARIIADRFLAEEDFQIPNEEIFKIINKYNFRLYDYIYFIEKLRTKVQPEIILEIFDNIKDKDSTTLEAYCYALYEYQMIDRLKEEISRHSDLEFVKKYEILLKLRDEGNSEPATLFYKLR